MLESNQTDTRYAERSARSCSPGAKQQEGGERLDLAREPTLVLQSGTSAVWFTCHMTSASTTVSHLHR